VDAASTSRYGLSEVAHDLAVDLRDNS
jgi:hypothetical protein